MSTDVLLVTTTVGGVDAARALGRALVEARLAASVQMLPIESIYRWEGDVESAAEHLLICKIRTADYPEVEAEIGAHHTYDVPEIVAVPIAAGSPGYLAWLAEATAR